MASPARTLQVQLLSDVRDGVKGIDKLDKRVGGLTKSLKGLALGVGLAFGAKEVLDFANAAVRMADDIDQSEGKLKQLLGRNAKAVKSFAKNSKAIGISRRAALQYTSSLSSLMRVQGFNQREAAESSVRWTKLAADMAAFNNASPEEVLQGMQAALAGEFDPLKRMGVLLNATKVQQFAWTHGIAKNGKALTDRQKLLATEQLLMKQTALQQGQLSRESNTLGARQNRLNAAMEDLQATLGTFLLPIYANVVEFFGTVANALLGIAEKGWSAGRAVRFILKSLGVPKEEIDKLAANFENLVGAIRTGIEKGDWTAVQKTLQDTLSATISTLQDNEQVLLTVGAVAVALGTTFAAAMFAVKLFLAAAQLPFTLVHWGARTAIGLAVIGVGHVLGLTFSAAMFATKLFVKAVTTMLALLTTAPAVLAAARTLGLAFGLSVRTAFLSRLGPVGLAIIAGMTISDLLGDDANNTLEGAREIQRRLNEMNNKKPKGRQQGFASGTLGASPGWHWVGERGPELVKFRGGERVLNNSDSMRGGASVNLSISVNAPVAADGARVGQQILQYIDQALGRGHRLRNRAALTGG